MADGTVDHHLVTRVLGLGYEVAQLPQEVKADVRVVDADGTGEGVVGVVGVEMDVLIGIALEVEVTDDAFCLDVLRRRVEWGVGRECAAERQAGNETAKVVRIEQLPQVELLGLYQTVEVLLTVHRALYVDVADAGKDGAVERDLAVVVLIEDAGHLESIEACHLCRDAGDDFREEVDAGVGEQYAVHLEMPGGGVAVILQPPVGMDVDIVLSSHEPEVGNIQPQVGTIEGRRERKRPLEIL